MTEPSDIVERLELVASELRRQGRAAVSAQAAAEACLAELHRMNASGGSAEARSEPPPRERSSEALVRSLLPALDALDRAISQARAAADRVRSSNALARWLAPARSRDLDALAEGLALVRQQAESALAEHGVRVERPGAGQIPDPERHRIVEVRTARSARAGTIMEVVRPGYYAGTRVIREAEVVAAAERSGLEA